MSGRGHFEGEHLLLRKSHECLLPMSKSTRHMGEGYREDGKPQVDDTVIYQDSCRCAHGGRCRRSAFKNKASEKLLQGVCGGLEITVGHSLPRTSGWCSCTRYWGHPAGVVVYNCWPPLPYHHPHFSGPPSSSSHPLHYPGDPYYGNPVASETSVLLCQLGGFGDEC